MNYQIHLLVPFFVTFTVLGAGRYVPGGNTTSRKPIKTPEVHSIFNVLRLVLSFSNLGILTLLKTKLLNSTLALPIAM